MKLLMTVIKQLVLPNGWKPKIASFFQAKFSISTIVVIFNKKNKVLLFHHTYREKPWGLPGGFLKKDEYPVESVVREVFEESSFCISNLKQWSIILDKYFARLTIIYVTNKISGRFRSSNEVSKFNYFSIDKLPQLPRGQTQIIKDSLKFLLRN